MSIDAGSLNQKIDLQASTPAADGGGGNVKAWATTKSGLCAKIEPLNGGEAFSQGVARATQFYRITIRWRAGVSARNRIIWNGVILNIRTCCDPDGRREALVMTAESGAGEA